MKALASFSRGVDRLNELIGRAVSWLMLAMALIAFSVVVLRYGFSLGWVWLQESYVWLYAVVFMLGAAYTLAHDAHVRVDLVYRGARARYKALVDLGGVVFLLLPVIWLIADVALPYVADSWQRLEASRETGGLPGLFLLKSVILAFCVLMGLQGLSMGARAVLILAGREALLASGERAR